MKKQFYSHLVTIDSIALELERLDMSEQERSHLLVLVDSTLHHTITQAVLDELSSEEKKVFLDHVQKGEHDKVWQLFDTRTKKIEEKIKVISEELKKELSKDIQEEKRYS
jgi:hypothetical protein